MDGMNLSQGFSATQAGISSQGMHSVNGKEVVLTQQNTILDLKPGEVFRGEIVAVGGEEVQLKLANEQILVARMEGRVQLAIGQILGFQVQSNENAKVVLKPVLANQMQMQVGEAALKTAGLPLNEKNIQLITDMIENGLPIDKKGLSDVYRQVLQHPDADMHTIVQLNKLHLPINDTNIQQIENYQNLSYRLQDSIADVMEDIWNVLSSEEHKEYGSGTVMEYEKQISDDINVINSDATYNLKTENDIMTKGMTDPAQNEIKAGAEQTLSTADTTSKVQYMEKILHVFLSKMNPTEISKSDVSLQIDGQLSSDNQVQGKEQLQQNVQLQHVEDEHSLLENETHITAQKVVESLEMGNTSIYQLTDLLEKSTSFPLEEKIKLFHTKTFRDFLEHTIRDEWSLTPDEIAKEGKVQEFYNRLQKQLLDLENIISQENHNVNSMPKALHNMRQNLEFMNEMNQVFQYVQLPVKFTQNKTNGELYVYTNKKKFTGNEGTLTAFLHLDMEHMGPVNVHVSLETVRNRVNTRFEVMPDMIPFLSSYLKELDKRIENIGYTVKSGISPINDEKSVIQQLEEQAGASNVTLSYQTFDMRA